MQNDTYAIDARESERISILKLWFCLLVVLIHVSRLGGIHFAEGTVKYSLPLWLNYTEFILSKVIAKCAVPGFFFVSGMLLFRKPFAWKENVRKKLRSLVVPYLLLNTFWIAVFYISQRIPFTRPFFGQPINIVKNWSAYDWLNAYLGICRQDNSAIPILGVTWFMRDLFVLNLIAPALKWIMDRLPKISFAALCVMLILGINTHLFFLRRDALVFFCFGYAFVKRGLHFSDLDNTPPHCGTSPLRRGCRTFAFRKWQSRIHRARLCQAVRDSVLHPLPD